MFAFLWYSGDDDDDDDAIDDDEDCGDDDDDYDADDADDDEDSLYIGSDVKRFASEKSRHCLVHDKMVLVKTMMEWWNGPG